jgi:hypothetical protein
MAIDVAIRIGVDDVLQRMAELAERVHAFFHRLAAEYFRAQLQPTVVKVFIVHRPFSCPIAERAAGCLQ